MKWNTVGFPSIKTFFSRAIDDGSLGHAYLLYGQDHIGKKTLAIEIAGLINGGASQAGFLKIIAPDREAGELSIGIEKAREIKRFLSATPLSGSKNVVIIDEAQELTEEAANAILKILEEPPASALIFLITRVPDLLSSTIQSRCVSLYCHPQSRKEIESELASAGLTNAQNDFLAVFINGRMGLLKNLVESGKYKAIKENISTLAKLIQEDTNQRLAWSAATAVGLSHDELEELILSWLAYIRLGQQNVLWGIVPELMRLLAVIREPQYNLQLMLDGFVVSLSRH
jgi:DNA polymerase-3 subunit delta'